MQSKSRRKELLSDSDRDQTPSESELHLPARAHVSNVTRAHSSAGDDAMKQPSANTPPEPPALGLQLHWACSSSVLQSSCSRTLHSTLASSHNCHGAKSSLPAWQRGLIAMEDVTLNGLTFVTMVWILIGFVNLRRGCSQCGVWGGRRDQVIQTKIVFDGHFRASWYQKCHRTMI